MGTAFALNLIADGHRVLAFDRDPAHVTAVRGAGAEGLFDLAGLAACDTVLTSLPHDDVVTAVALVPRA
jgi:3-hydroxyisobutyrate dehydrogenase-like beta-hydroxyacid dehydrogenase